MYKPLVIALVGDYGYINQIETTIKSIIYHNHDCKIYVINPDIPQEWFFLANQRLAIIHCKIIDKKILPKTLAREFAFLDQVSVVAYAKFLLPRLLSDSRVLYLDSDVIVNNSLTQLFYQDLQGHPLAAVEDYDEHNGHFNSGVLLLDLDHLRRIPNFVSQALKLGQDRSLKNADQDVFNHFFKDDYLALPLADNYQIGMDSIAYYHSKIKPYLLPKLDSVTQPVITHFLTNHKPWKDFSSGRLRELWWQYYGLSWEDAVYNRPLPLTQPNLYKRFFTFLMTEETGRLVDLAKACPQYEFNVATWVPVGPKIHKLLQYPNIHVYEHIVGRQIEELVKHCDAYLDVDCPVKEHHVLKQFAQHQTPFLAFANVADHYHHYPNYRVFDDDDLQGFIDALKQI